jgi:hypothetical protein
MVVVTMTSWVKRIGNVKHVVESVMNNTIKPDRLYLNLSLTEFHGIELPEDLVEYFNSDERLIINWVDGENTKSMKKVFPILEFLDDDDIIINIDDDALFPNNFIKSRCDDFKIKNAPITSCNNPKYHYVSKTLKIWSCGPGSLFQKKMLKGYEQIMDDKLIHTYNDDWCYSTLLWLNGYKFEPCSSYFMQNGAIDNNGTKLKKFNAVEPMGKNHVYIDQECMYNILEKRIMDLFGVGFKDSFGILNNKKHDCVMVYGKNGVDSQEMTCGNYLEMEYVIASLKKYCSSWVGRIFIVGSEPPERVKKDVIHVPCDNPYIHCKDANIIHKLRYACENIQDLSDDFLMISDDQIVTKNSSWEDMKPRIVRMYSDWTEEKWKKNRKMDTWHEYLYKTLNLFPKNKVAFWEPHIWSPINKYKFIEMCKKYNYQKDISCITQSLYYNFINETPIRGFDHLHLGNKNSKKINCLTISRLPRHLSWTDDAFSEKQFRDILDIVVGFKTMELDKTNELNNSNNTSVIQRISSLQKIREGIQNGTIIKERKPDGTYIWKKVRK